MHTHTVLSTSARMHARTHAHKHTHALLYTSAHTHNRPYFFSILLSSVEQWRHLSDAKSHDLCSFMLSPVYQHFSLGLATWCPWSIWGAASASHASYVRTCFFSIDHLSTPHSNLDSTSARFTWHVFTMMFTCYMVILTRSRQPESSIGRGCIFAILLWLGCLHLSMWSCPLFSHPHRIPFSWPQQ